MTTAPDRILAVAAAIEAAPDGKFNMASWMKDRDHRSVDSMRAEAEMPKPTECGTAACIAGWAVWTFPEEAEAIRERANFPPDIEDVAQEILGLGFDESYRLFRGRWERDVPIQKITKESAVAELRRLAETIRRDG